MQWEKWKTFPKKKKQIPDRQSKDVRRANVLWPEGRCFGGRRLSLKIGDCLLFCYHRCPLYQNPEISRNLREIRCFLEKIIAKTEDRGIRRQAGRLKFSRYKQTQWPGFHFSPWTRVDDTSYKSVLMDFHIVCQRSNRRDVSNLMCIKTELVSMLPVLLLAEGGSVTWNVRLVWQKGYRRLCADLTNSPHNE